MATSEEKPTKNNIKEGSNLLGSPTFKQLDNGRFKCVETGHELPAHAQDSYSQSKRCRIGLIDFSLAHKKPPLNMFKQDPLNSSKLICKLTDDTINKSEEHIWKHINGKRFFNKLEQMEAGKLSSSGDVEEKGEKQGKAGLKKEENGAEKKKKKQKKMKETKKEEIVSEMRDSPGLKRKENGAEKKKEKQKKMKETKKEEIVSDSDLEGLEFWMPPAGERWDFDDGGDRWGSDSESGDQHDEDGEKGETSI
ncbi:hypothetical protein SOVF_062540 [Spinacia oleracea]|uniref:Surfeit locus protein 2 n=1 Tax=Spinacia oleracea TaxID=3562 RepID=A0A9R0HQD3_SPIOL|nr:uncharacterized protein LOC110774700 [Spinacia oleracea]KNA19331.1 hypothetical protein SOVF_062540 [Spinacia oleracea]